MLKQLARRFLTAMLLVCVGLVSMLVFMKSSKPEEMNAQAGTHKHASSEDHLQCAAKILGTPLPRVALRDMDDVVFSPVEFSQQQPVILIRYLGYGCSHCIEQLLLLRRYTNRLKAANIRVIAFSEDTPEENRTLVQKYSFDTNVFAFAFDPAQSLGRSIGAVYKEADGSLTELHVSLVVHKGRVNFAHFDTKPMMNVEELLKQANIVP